MSGSSNTNGRRVPSSPEPRAGAAPPARLDATDVAILDLLQSGSKITNAELAKRVGIAPPTALERVKKLEQRGVIRGYVALLEPAAVNKKTSAIVHLTLREHGQKPLERIKKELAALEEVLDCWHTAGEEDFILRVLVTDMQAYEDFVVNRLSAIAGIGRIRTTFVLNTVKRQTRTPLDAALTP